MEFNSYVFILALLPIVVFAVQFLEGYEKRQWKALFLIVASCIFVSFYDWKILLFLMVSGVINYSVGLQIQKEKQNKFWVSLGIIFNVLALAITKYAVFGWELVRPLIHSSFRLESIWVPLGISFVTFQQIAFLVDLERGNITRLHPVEYAFYILYFPKYVQGPITGYQDLVSQPKQESTTESRWEDLSYGLYLFAIGLGKKVLIADVLAKAVAYGWNGLENLSMLDGILTMVFFTLQIYFDFSGYSHMAIGVSKMLHVSLPDNFDRPYLACSITEFWKKWHISLTDFLRKYLYIPLGGNRKGTLKTYWNVFLVYAISGLWHGANLTFVVWGILHGLASCLDRLIGKLWKKLPKLLQWMGTFAFVNVAWVFFRAPSVKAACTLLQRIFQTENVKISEGMLGCFHLKEFIFLEGRIPGLEQFIGTHLYLLLLFFLAISVILILKGKDKVETKFRPTLLKAIGAMLILWWSVLSLSTVVEFIYANF